MAARKTKKQRKPGEKFVPMHARPDVEHRRNLQTLHGGVRKFLHDAGVEAHDFGNGVEVGDALFVFTPEDLTTPALVPPVVDRLVGELLADRLLHVVAKQLADRGSLLNATKCGSQVHVQDVQRQVAVVSATRATVLKPRRVIHGNFLLAAGQHWEALDRHLIHPHLNTVATTSAEPLTTFPDELHGTRRLDALRASARIRQERSREIGLDTRIDLPERSSSVRFSPVLPASPPQVAFVYTCPDALIRGALRLRTAQDPLALVLEAELDDGAILAEVWSMVLRTFADLTCVSAEFTADSGSTDDHAAPLRVPATMARSGQPTARHSAARPLEPRHLTLPRSLEPTSGTRKLLGTHVAGYRRVLPAGQSPGDDARRRAEDIGIVLGPSETWVRPHIRGVATATELVFTWRESSVVLGA